MTTIAVAVVKKDTRWRCCAFLRLPTTTTVCHSNADTPHLRFVSGRASGGRRLDKVVAKPNRLRSWSLEAVWRCSLNDPGLNAASAVQSDRHRCGRSCASVKAWLPRPRLLRARAAHFAFRGSHIVVDTCACHSNNKYVFGSRHAIDPSLDRMHWNVLYHPAIDHWVLLTSSRISIAAISAHDEWRLCR